MLKQNGNLLAQYPFRQIGGGMAGERGMWNRTESRNVFAGGVDQKSAIPSGHLSPSAWVLPQKPGGMSAFTSVAGAGTSSASGALGMYLDPINIEGAGDIVSAACSLVVSAIATIVGEGTLDSAIAGKLDAASTMAGAGDLDGALGAIAGAAADLIGSGTMVGTARATALISATITAVSGIVSNEGVAEAVWNYLITAGIPAAQLQRIMAAVLAGKVSGMDTGAPVFLDLDGVTPRVTATTDAAGNRLDVDLG